MESQLRISLPHDTIMSSRHGESRLGQNHILFQCGGFQWRCCWPSLCVSALLYCDGKLVSNLLTRISSSKSALHGLVHWLAGAYSKAGITVNGVAPALIQGTAMLPGTNEELAKSELHFIET